MRTLEHLKWSVANKIIQIVNAEKFFNGNNMKNFDGITSFTKFDIYCIIPEPSGVDCPGTSVDHIYMPVDGFHSTCSPIWRAYQKTLAGVDPQIYFGGFSG